MSTNFANDYCPLLHQVYAEQLRSHSIELIWMGHKRLNPALRCVTMILRQFSEKFSEY